MKNHIQLNLEWVRPIDENARLIMEWRNDPETRRMSFHSEPKQWESFYRHFKESYFSFPHLPPLFVIENGQRVAFLSLKPVTDPLVPERKCCEVSIHVAPEHRGRGIGTQSLRLIKEFALTQGINSLFAEIKSENTASQKAFEQAGFSKIDAIQKTIFDTGESVPTLRYLAVLKENSPKKRTFIIAEIGSNWCLGRSQDEDIQLAKQMIQEAARAGASAVKFQVFRPETIYVPNAGSSDYLAANGIKEDIYGVFERLRLPPELIPVFASYATEQGVVFMASCFSPADLAVVDPYVDRHKIASYEIGHIRLIQAIARTGKPVYLSTGAATEEEIAWAVDKLRSEGCHRITLLQCSARYPAEPESLNLRTIPWLKQCFGVEVGFSDHSANPVIGPLAAVSLGATVIEKHFTLDKGFPGPDHAFAITPPELKSMVDAIRLVESMLGSDVKTVHEVEYELREYARRGIQATKDIKVGDVFHEGINVDILRPGKQIQGIHPLFISHIEGKASKRAISKGSGIQLGDI